MGLIIPAIVLGILTVVHGADVGVPCRGRGGCAITNNPGNISPHCEQNLCVCDASDKTWFFDNRNGKTCYKKTGETCELQKAHEQCDPNSQCVCERGNTNPGCPTSCKCKQGCTPRSDDMGCDCSHRGDDDEDPTPELVQNPFPVECTESNDCKITNAINAIKPVCEKKGAATGTCTCSAGNPIYYFDNRMGEGDYKCYKKTLTPCVNSDECDPQSKCDCKPGQQRPGCKPMVCVCKEGNKEREGRYGCDSGCNLQTSLVLVVAAMFLINKMA